MVIGLTKLDVAARNECRHYGLTVIDESAGLPGREEWSALLWMEPI